jgi:hypothetical protein
MPEDDDAYLRAIHTGVILKAHWNARLRNRELLSKIIQYQYAKCNEDKSLITLQLQR